MVSLSMLKNIHLLSPPTTKKKDLAVYLLNNHFCIYFFYLRYRINHTLSNLKGKKNKTKKDLSFFLTTAEFYNIQNNPQVK